jgi:hypothetical protein
MSVYMTNKFANAQSIRRVIRPRHLFSFRHRLITRQYLSLHLTLNIGPCSSMRFFLFFVI